MSYQLSRTASILGADRSTQPTKITVAAVTATSAVLTAGTWEIVANTACYFRQGASTVVATANDHYLPAGTRELIRVTIPATDGYVAALRVAADGVMFISKLTRTL